MVKVIRIDGIPSITHKEIMGKQANFKWDNLDGYDCGYPPLKHISMTFFESNFISINLYH